MSDLAATNCGCGCDNSCDNGCGMGRGLFGSGDSCCNIIWILILLSIFCGNNHSDCDCGSWGNNSCLWIILLLIFCGGCN